MEIVNYPNYLIYDNGRVYSKKRKIFLKPFTDNMGYLQVQLYNKGKGKKIKVHRLVGLHYLPKVEGKELLDHIDRNKHNNHIDNLRWCNHSENKYNTGLQKNNKSGYKQIVYREGRAKCYIVKKVGQSQKGFKTLEEAIEYRDNYNP